MMAVNSSIPNIPRLEIVNVLPGPVGRLQFFIMCTLSKIFYFHRYVRQ